MMRFFSCLLAAAFICAAVPSNAFILIRGGGNLGTAPQSIASVGLSGSTFTPGAASGTPVGVVSVTMSPASPSFSGSLSLSGADAASFQLVSTTVETNGVLCGSPPCTYHINVVATQAGVSNSPFTQAFTITSSNGTTLALTRNFNQPTGTSTPASAFWMIGQPFHKTTDLPSGNSLTATLGGNPVRMGACQRKQEIDGSVGWSQIMVDYSGQTITPGSNKSLVFTSAAGSWTDTNPNSDASLQAQWTGLNDTVTIASVSTTSTGGSDMNAGPYTATFNSSAQITVMCTNPLEIGRAHV